MRLTLYQLDAFSAKPFAGNPAAVVPLDEPLPAETMQAIAAENNLAETAFLEREGQGWRLRWFTPSVEVDLCGHATLATAWVVFNKIAPSTDQVSFATRSGQLIVRKGEDGMLVLDFPARPPSPVDVPPGLTEALGAKPREVLGARDLLCVFDSAAQVRNLKPDLGKIAALPWFAAIVTAPGDGEADFVSRFFAPAKGVPEDPVTGSAHCTLVPYWAKRLGKLALTAHQVSQRGGELFCRDRGERVEIGGHVTPFLEGVITL